MSEPTAENDVALAALDRLADQAFHTAGDDAGRQRVLDDRAAVMRVIQPGSRCTCGVGDHRPPGAHGIHCADPDGSAVTGDPS
jgi:hypothetical protein